MIEKIMDKEDIIAIIIRDSYHNEGIEFVTPGEFSQQLASMSHKKGHKIIPHFHNRIQRDIHYTQEVLIIKDGKLRADFYDSRCRYLESAILEKGDIMLLSSGGHGFEVLEDLVMVEVKQGPYSGDNDKTRFDGIQEKNIIIRKNSSEQK